MVSILLKKVGKKSPANLTGYTSMVSKKGYLAREATVAVER
jgi:hypothetical protein